jgi:hypothetical protein
MMKKKQNAASMEHVPGHRLVKLLIALTPLLIAAGCSHAFLEKHQAYQNPDVSSQDIPAGFGTVQVHLTRGTARTVIPDPVELNTLHLEYLFTPDGGTAEKKDPADGKFILEAGTYTLTVEGFLDAENPASLTAWGETDVPFTVSAGADAGTVNITLRPVVTGEGTGSLEFCLQYPAGATVVTLTLIRIAGDEAIDLLDPMPTPSGSDPLTLIGMKNDIPVGYYLLRAVLRNSAGVSAGMTEVVHIYQNLTAKTALAEYTFTAGDFSAYLVTNANDSGLGSLRQALTDAPAGETIRVALEPGSVIELQSSLPPITQTITLEGNGVTLTPASSWKAVDTSSQLLYISSSTAEVKIHGVHFKNGRATDNGGAIRNTGTLTLESCIFSGNQSTASGAYGGAVYSANTLTIRGCTFSGNTAGWGGGAVYFDASGKCLTLTGNLFSGNTALYYAVAYVPGGTVSASYNVVDVAQGTGSFQCGWAAGTGDTLITGLPISGRSFRLLPESGAAGVIAALPAGYPVADFYGAPITANAESAAAAGAVQAVAAGTGYYLDLSVNDIRRGTVTVSLADEDGLVSGSFAVTPSPNPGYYFRHWLVNGQREASAPTGISALTLVQAVFGRLVTVDTFTDWTDSIAPGTLRYALTDAQEGDSISFSGVVPGTTSIRLQSVLPRISKSISIEGNGITLTPASSSNNSADTDANSGATQSGSGWTSSSNSQLLDISSVEEVKISRVHFKNGRASDYGGAIHNTGILTLESCIFSGNQNSTKSTGGGAIHSDNILTVRGCTFYGNNSGVFGGAIWFYGQTLTLTGNLFYGNTVLSSSHGSVSTGSWPVVYAPSGRTVSASYNAVDTAFGTGQTQCGWAAGTGDKLLAALGISGAPVSAAAFEPVSGLSSVLPSTRPAGFPETDFYGTTRTSPGAPGAVR